MSITDILKQAYENKDWNLVSDAYKTLTGTGLGALPSKTPAKVSKGTKKRVNLFVDDGTECTEDRAVPPAPIVGIKGSRPSNLTNAVCNNCGKLYENISKRLIGRKYICDKCIDRKGTASR